MKSTARLRGGFNITTVSRFSNFKMPATVGSVICMEYIAGLGSVEHGAAFRYADTADGSRQNYSLDPSTDWIVPGIGEHD